VLTLEADMGGRLGRPWEVSNRHEISWSGSAAGSAHSIHRPRSYGFVGCWGCRDSRRHRDSRNWSISFISSIWSVWFGETRTGLPGLFGLSRSFG
jgi:hypothetical protein